MSTLRPFNNPLFPIRFPILLSPKTEKKCARGPCSEPASLELPILEDP